MTPRTALMTAWLILSSAAVAADTTRAAFDVSLLGVRLGVLQLQGTMNGARYDAAVRFATTGVVGTLRDFDVTMQVAGRAEGPRLRPRAFSETVVAGGERKAARLDYRGGVPVLTGDKLESEGSPALDPRAQRDTIDPLTATFILMRDQPSEGLCTLDQPLFDGVRRTRIVMRRTAVSAGGITCSGTFRRLEGYAPEQLARGREVRMTFTYRPAGTLMQLQSVRFRSSYGPVVIARR